MSNVTIAIIQCVTAGLVAGGNSFSHGMSSVISRNVTQSLGTLYVNSGN